MNSRTININLTNVKFKNSIVIYENFIKCTIKDYEMNLSYNPTLLSGSQAVLTPYSSSNSGSIFYIPAEANYGTLKDFVTGSISGSDFSPYVTMVGLYNDSNDLLAIGKMAAPMPLSSNTDQTFLIKWDTKWSPKPYFTPSVTPSFSPSLTPSTTPSISVTPSVTPSISITATPSVTPSVTPSISISPSSTPATSVTPSVTPTISVTPSITPSISVTPSPESSTLAVYARWFDGTAELQYSINGGSPVSLGIISSLTCAFVDTITGLVPGDQVVFTTPLTQTIAGSPSSPCPTTGFGCNYTVNISGGANYVYLTLNGTNFC